MWNLRQNLESSGHQEKNKSHTERPWWTREQFTFMWNLRQNLESSGHQEKYKSHTSLGRKFAPVEGLSHDLVCTGSIYHVHFALQVWHGQLSPRFTFNKLKSFSGVEIDQNHVDKRILGGKGFAVGRLKRHNFCPASVVVKLELDIEDVLRTENLENLQPVRLVLPGADWGIKGSIFCLSCGKCCSSSPHLLLILLNIFFWTIVSYAQLVAFGFVFQSYISS